MRFPIQRRDSGQNARHSFTLERLETRPQKKSQLISTYLRLFEE